MKNLVKMIETKIIEGIQKVAKGDHLSSEESQEIMREIMTGKVTGAQLGGLLTGLAIKGETIEEITGFAKAMREFSIRIEPQVEGVLLDTCGTGGDKTKTFNISTITALVVAGAGIHVAKHGNRSVTSKCGSADLLEGFGVNLNLEPENVKNSIEKIGIGFMFAPLFHPAMIYAMPTRRELKIRTVFNILGPLTNPANAECHTLGVFQKDLVPIMAIVLGNLGGKHIITVHNSCGIDELAPVGINYITEYRDGNIENFALTNKDFDLPDCKIEDILAGNLEENLKITIEILKNNKADAKYNTVLMNSALALKSANKTNDLREGVLIAKDSIESGKAYKKLQEIVKVSGGNIEKINSHIS